MARKELCPLSDGRQLDLFVLSRGQPESTGSGSGSMDSVLHELHSTQRSRSKKRTSSAGATGSRGASKGTKGRGPNASDGALGTGN